MLDSWSKRLYRFSAMLLMALQYHLFFFGMNTHWLPHFCNKELTQNCPPVVIL